MAIGLPDVVSDFPGSVVQAERDLSSLTRSYNPLDLTYADTKRFPPPPEALEAFVAAASGQGMTYTPYRGDAGVREVVAARLASLVGIDVDPERQLIITPGTQAALFLSLAVLVSPGDLVLVADPDYISDERILRYLGARVERVRVEARDGVGLLDLDALRRGLRDGGRVVLLSNPNNPTGAVYGSDVLEAVASLACEHNALVVVDELYCRLVYDARPFHHLVGYEGMLERSVTLLGPSKTESMSGFRVGAAIAPASIIDDMEDLLGVTALRAPAYAQHTLRAWLGDDAEFIASRVAEYQALRDLTVRHLRESGVVEVDSAGGTAYLFPTVLDGEGREHEIARHLLTQANVVINPGYQFGPSGQGHFRICFAQDERVWPATLERIERALATLVAPS